MFILFFCDRDRADDVFDRRELVQQEVVGVCGRAALPGQRHEAAVARVDLGLVVDLGAVLLAADHVQKHHHAARAGRGEVAGRVVDLHGHSEAAALADVIGDVPRPPVRRRPSRIRQTRERDADRREHYHDLLHLQSSLSHLKIRE